MMFRLSKLANRLARLKLIVCVVALGACASGDALTAPDAKVVPDHGQSIAVLEVSPPAATGEVGGTLQLTTTSKDSTGGIIVGRTVTFVSADEDIATTADDGSVRLLGVGQTSITVTAGSAAKVITVSVEPALADADHSGRFVSPSGSSSSDGSKDSPWDLATALAGGNGHVGPGDTIWLRGGTYRGQFVSTLTGTSSKWIVVRQYPGERATLDGVGLASTTDQLKVMGSYSQFMDFEVMNSGTSRYSTEINHNYRPNNVVNHGAHNRYVGLVVHDGGTGFYSWSQYADVEVNGCLFYNIGWDAPDRGHGHAMYLKNDNGPLLAKDNVIFDQYGYGIHIYTNVDDGLLNGITADGNVSFNNGSVSSIGASSANLANKGVPLANGLRVTNNVAYYSPSVAGENIALGSGSGLVATGNTAIGATGITQDSWSGATVNSNTTLASGAGSLSVIVRKNSVESGRANVVVYNPDGNGSVSANLSGVLSTGDHYVVHNVYDLYGSPVASGTYSGGSITIPISGSSAPTPIGGSKAPPSTGKTFAVFVVARG